MLAQLVRALACHARGRGFESRTSRQSECKPRNYSEAFCFTEAFALFGLNDTLLDFISHNAREYNVSRLVLFGSRAKGTYTEKSDIDLAISGGDTRSFMAQLDEHAPTLLVFDLIDMDGSVSHELLSRIQEEGVVLYEQVQEL